MTKRLARLMIAAVLWPDLALAAPVGRWFSDSDQGSPVYGIIRDGTGLDTLTITCGPDAARLRVTIGSARPRPRDLVKFVIDGREWDLFTNDAQEITPDGQDAGNFLGLWSGLRRGQALRVRLASGGTAAFTLRGAGKVLPPQPCGVV